MKLAARRSHRPQRFNVSHKNHRSRRFNVGPKPTTTMTKESLRQRLYDIIESLMSEVCENIHVTDTSSLVNDLYLESLDFIDLIVKIETVFDIKIQPGEVTKTTTVQDLLALIERKLLSR